MQPRPVFSGFFTSVAMATSVQNDSLCPTATFTIHPLYKKDPHPPGFHFPFPCVHSLWAGIVAPLSLLTNAAQAKTLAGCGAARVFAVLFK